MRRFYNLSFLFLFLVSVTTHAQQTQIKGTVTDIEGLVLPGVSIVIKGKVKGTQTDFDGNYTLNAAKGDVLVFSFIGLKPIERVVQDSSVIDVQFLEDSMSLEEVVVLGYATTVKTELTGSTVQIKSEQFEQVPVASIDQVLQGKVAGLSFTGNSGTPGSTTDIRIRGNSSITAGNEPLYVIDGVPTVNPNVSSSSTSAGSSLTALSSINSSDIESITVLKDASATAAYGARGANGVIVITTKSGKSGETKFKLTSSTGFANDATDGPTVLTGAEREMLFYEAIYNTYGASYGFNEDGAQAFYEANPGAFGTDYVNWNAAGRPETSWADVISNKNALIQEYNFSASGGKEDYNFYASIGYYDQEATVIGADFNRTSGTVNFSKNFSDKIKFSTRNSASHTYQEGVLETSAYFSNPRAVKFFMPSIDYPYNPDGSLNLNTTTPNPLYIANENMQISKLTRIMSNNSLEWQTPINNLSFKSLINIDYQTYNFKTYYNRILGDGANTDGYGNQSHSDRVNYVFQNSLDYLLDLGNHQVSFKVLQEFQKNKYYFLDAEGDSFPEDGLTNLSSAGNPTYINSFFTDWAVASYMGTAHYSYDGKYILDATYRLEGNSRFASSKRWGNFWSVGAAWNINKESFLADSNFINNLKLRGSYGVTGNANISLNQYQALFSYNDNYAGEGGSYASTFGNEDLSWETSHTLDVGLEFGLLKNRIIGSIAYYRRESKDLLLDVPLSLTTGFEDQTRNIGRMENKGIELELNFDLIRSQDINFSIGGNFSTNENKVLELAKDANGNDINITTTTDRVEVGHPVFGWYMPTWAGVDPANGDELWYVDGEGSATTNTYTEAGSVWQKSSPLPKYIAGMNLHLDVKGFFLDVNAYYAGGHQVMDEWHRYTQGTDFFTTSFYQGMNVILDRWQEPGDTGNRFGRMQATTFPWRQHSKFLFDGDYLRIKNLTFGYDFSDAIVKTIGLESARIFVRGTNLFTWVKDDNFKYDPEVDADGFANLTTPPVKSLIVGFNINF